MSHRLDWLGDVVTVYTLGHWTFATAPQKNILGYRSAVLTSQLPPIQIRESSTPQLSQQKKIYWRSNEKEGECGKKKTLSVLDFFHEWGMLEADECPSIRCTALSSLWSMGVGCLEPIGDGRSPKWRSQEFIEHAITLTHKVTNEAQTRDKTNVRWERLPLHRQSSTQLWKPSFKKEKLWICFWGSVYRTWQSYSELMNTQLFENIPTISPW